MKKLALSKLLSKRKQNGMSSAVVQTHKWKNFVCTSQQTHVPPAIGFYIFWKFESLDEGAAKDKIVESRYE